MIKSLLFFSIVLSTRVLLQAQLVPVTNYNTFNGLVNNYTGLITQDEAGYLWIGTGEGISNYDGRSFHFFPGPRSTYYFGQCDANHYKQFAVLSTARQGIALCYKDRIIFRQFKGSDTTFINVSLMLDDNSFLIGCLFKKGLLLIKDSMAYPVVLPQWFTAKAGGYYSIRRDIENNIWVGTDNGLIFFPKGDLSKPFFPEAFTNRNITAIKQDIAGNIYVTSTSSVYKYNCRGIRTTDFPEPVLIHHDSLDYYNAIEVDHNGLVYLGSSHHRAILVLDGNGHEINRLGIPKISGRGYMWDLFEDREQNIWAALEIGILKVTNFPVKYFTPGETDYPDYKSGIFLNDTEFIVTNGSSACCVKDYKNKSLQTNQPLLIGLLGERFFKTSDGRTWITNYEPAPPHYAMSWECFFRNDSLIFGSRIKDKYHGPAELDFANACNSNNGLSFVLTKDGKPWLYDSHFFYPLLPARNLLQMQLHLTAVASTPGGNLIAVDSKWGLTELKINRINNVYYFDTAHTEILHGGKEGLYKKMFFNKDGSLWIGGIKDEGMLTYKKDKDGFYHLQERIAADRLSSGLIKDITGDSTGNIYVASNNGIDKISYWEGVVEKIKKSVFNQYLTGRDIYFLKCMHDKLYIGTTGSFAIIDLKAIHTPLVPPGIFINELRVNNQAADSLLPQQNAGFSPEDNTMAFTFTGISFANEKALLYKYMMEGVDKNWSRPSVAYTAIYTQLKPGHYTFKVMAQNSNGVWSKEPASFSFVIHHPFYQQWWFMVLCVLIGALFMYSVYRLQLSKAIAVERTRNLISKDLHDDIGAALSSITLMNAVMKNKIREKPDDAVQMAEKIELTSRETIQNMSDIVWRINPGNDNIEKLLTRLQQFAADVFDDTGIAHRLSVDNNLLKKQMAMELRRDVYLICKEIINNAAKYSKAGRFDMQVKLDKNELLITASDNGIGFIKDGMKRGNGLLNIQQRALQHRGRCELNTAEGKGTRWTIILPLNKNGNPIG